MTIKELNNWVDNLSLKDRLSVQRFMLQLYCMERTSDGKDR